MLGKCIGTSTTKLSSHNLLFPPLPWNKPSICPLCDFALAFWGLKFYHLSLLYAPFCSTDSSNPISNANSLAKPPQPPPAPTLAPLTLIVCIFCTFLKLTISWVWILFFCAIVNFFQFLKAQRWPGSPLSYWCTEYMDGLTPDFPLSPN